MPVFRAFEDSDVCEKVHYVVIDLLVGTKCCAIGESRCILLRRKDNKRLAKFTVIGFLVLTFVVCGALGYKGHCLDVQHKAYQQELGRLKAESKALSKKQEEARAYEEYTKSNDFIEDTARKKLGLVYPGEIIFKPSSEE